MIKNCENPLVVHVDDDVNDRNLFQIASEAVNARFRILSFDGVRSAREYLLGQDDHAGAWRQLPALLLLDYHLGKNTGTELLSVLRMHAPLRSLGVVMLTDADSAEIVRACYLAGANSYLLKTGQFDRLKAIARTVDTALAGSPVSFATLELLAEFRGTASVHAPLSRCTG